MKLGIDNYIERDDGRYNGDVWRIERDGQCAICDAKGITVLECETSGGEFASVSICWMCVDTAFTNKQ